MKIGIREREQAFWQAFSQSVFWLRLRLGMAASLLGVINLASPHAVFANLADPSPMLRVRVNKYTQASPSIVAMAEREAGRILGEAGLRMVWLDCPIAAASRFSTIRVSSPLKLPISCYACFQNEPRTSFKTRSLVSQSFRFLPACTTTTRCAAPRGITTSSRSLSFWAASSHTNSGISCLDQTVTPARE